jgi:plasmid stabilization system protein ParE
VTYRLELRPEAFADIAEAFSWYEGQRAGLGAEFERELDRTFGLIVTMPAAGRVVHRTLRRALVRRFPFAVYYVLSGDLIEVRGVLHGSRHPRTWRRRA